QDVQPADFIAGSFYKHVAARLGDRLGALQKTVLKNNLLPKCSVVSYICSGHPSSRLTWKRLPKDCCLATKWNAGAWRPLRTCLTEPLSPRWRGNSASAGRPHRAGTERSRGTGWSLCVNGAPRAVPAD